MYCTVESLTEQNMAIARTVAIAKMHTTNSIWFLNPSIFSNHVYYLEIYKHGSHLKKMLSGRIFMVVATLLIPLTDWSIIGLNTFVVLLHATLCRL